MTLDIGGGHGTRVGHLSPYGSLMPAPTVSAGLHGEAHPCAKPVARLEAIPAGAVSPCPPGPHRDSAAYPRLRCRTDGAPAECLPRLRERVDMPSAS
jgi:hypothetical protein